LGTKFVTLLFSTHNHQSYKLCRIYEPDELFNLLVYNTKFIELKKLLIERLFLVMNLRSKLLNYLIDDLVRVRDIMKKKY
jgi:hypothetical protein